MPAPRALNPSRVCGCSDLTPTQRSYPDITVRLVRNRRTHREMHNNNIAEHVAIPPIMSLKDFNCIRGKPASICWKNVVVVFHLVVEEWRVDVAYVNTVGAVARYTVEVCGLYWSVLVTQNVKVGSMKLVRWAKVCLNTRRVKPSCISFTTTGGSEVEPSHAASQRA